jgi:hypothetical protein
MVKKLMHYKYNAYCDIKYRLPEPWNGKIFGIAILSVEIVQLPVSTIPRPSSTFRFPDSEVIYR